MGIRSLSRRRRASPYTQPTQGRPLPCRNRALVHLRGGVPLKGSCPNADDVADNLHLGEIVVSTHVFARLVEILRPCDKQRNSAPPSGLVRYGEQPLKHGGSNGQHLA